MARARLHTTAHRVFKPNVSEKPILYASNNPHPTSPPLFSVPSASEVTGKDVLRIVRRRAPIAAATFLVVCAAAAAFTVQMPKVYEAQARLLIESPASSSTPAGVISLFGGASNPLETEIEKIRSRSFLEQVAEKTHPLNDKNPDMIKGQLVITAAPNGQLLDITARAHSDEEARALANTTARLYMSYAQTEFEDKTNESERRLRLAAARAEKDKIAAEKKLSTFMAGIGLSDPSIFYSQRAQKTVAVQNGLEDAKKSLPLVQAQLERYVQQVRTIPPTIATGFTQNKNPVIDGFKKEIVDFRVQRKALLQDYAPDADEVKFVEEGIAERQKEIKQAESDVYSKGSVGFARNPDYSEAQSNVYRTQNALISTRNEIKASEALLAQLQTEQKTLAMQRNQYEGLSRVQAAAVGQYQQAINGLMGMKTQRLTSPPHLKLMDEAQLPPAPVSPKPLLNAVMAVFMGLFLGVGAALLAEYFSATTVPDNGNVSEGDLLLGLPHVAGVPLLGRVPLHALPSPASAGTTGGVLLPGLTDVLREVGYVLAHSDESGKPPVVLLSGTQNTDATASLSAQIAAALSRDGLRVTLVDADRANPRLNRVFGAPDAPGMADVLAGRCRAREILHIGADGGLRFLAAGSPDDAAPTTEAGARELFGELADARDTDIVLVSGPTVWSARRVAPLEKAASGMVLVAETVDGDESGSGPEETVARARRMLSNGYRPRLLGVVVSSSPPASATSAPVAVPLAAPVAADEAA